MDSEMQDAEKEEDPVVIVDEAPKAVDDADDVDAVSPITPFRLSYAPYIKF